MYLHFNNRNNKGKDTSLNKPHGSLLFFLRVSQLLIFFCRLLLLSLCCQHFHIIINLFAIRDNEFTCLLSVGNMKWNFITTKQLKLVHSVNILLWAQIYKVANEFFLSHFLNEEMCLLFFGKKDFLMSK